MDIGAIIGAVITGGFSLLGIVLTVNASNKKIEHRLEVSQAVMDTKIENLTQEVRCHNEFARRMPVVEEQIKVINHRLEDLERNERKTG